METLKTSQKKAHNLKAAIKKMKSEKRKTKSFRFRVNSRPYLRDSSINRSDIF